MVVIGDDVPQPVERVRPNRGTVVVDRNWPLIDHPDFFPITLTTAHVHRNRRISEDARRCRRALSQRHLPPFPFGAAKSRLYRSRGKQQLHVMATRRKCVVLGTPRILG